MFLRKIPFLISTWLLSFPAWAGGGEAAPSEVRVITSTTATSDCIGDPKTPVCAVETFLACIARLDHGLCAKVTKEPLQNTEKLFPFSYRVESSCYYWAAPENVAGSGDAKVLRASVAIRIHNFGDDLYYYSLAPTERGWEIVFHAIEGEVGPVEVECKPKPPPLR